jgi:hypothetical protein
MSVPTGMATSHMLVASLSAACFVVLEAARVKYMVKDQIDWTRITRETAWVFMSCLLGSYAAQSLGVASGAAPVVVFTDDPSF